MKIKLLSISLITFLTLLFNVQPIFASANSRPIYKQTFTQGKSKSDPDNNGKGPERNNGKSDKPENLGGINKADQDGNNGCGNDLDREDDNEGWCGQKPKTIKNETKDSDDKKDCSKEVEGKKPIGTVVGANAPKAEVASTVTLKELPNTGNNLSLNLFVAGLLISLGLALNLVSKKVGAKIYENQ